MPPFILTAHELEPLEAITLQAESTELFFLVRTENPTPVRRRLIPPTAQAVFDFSFEGGIQGGRGFIKEQNPRLEKKASHERHPRQLAPRKLRHRTSKDLARIRKAESLKLRSQALSTRKLRSLGEAEAESKGLPEKLLHAERRSGDALRHQLNLTAKAAPSLGMIRSFETERARIPCPRLLPTLKTHEPAKKPSFPNPRSPRDPDSRARFQKGDHARPRSRAPAGAQTPRVRSASR